MRWWTALGLIACLSGSLRAQTTIPVTGWYDGRGVENGFFNDGVPHGTYGLVGAGPSYTLWIPPFGYDYLTHLVRDPSMFLWKPGDTPTDPCNPANIGTFPSGILQINSDLYTFLGNMHEYGRQPADEPIQDPVAVIVRYGANGNYDLQQDLLYFPNPGIDPQPTSATAQYLWGMGPLFTVIQGPQLTLSLP